MMERIKYILAILLLAGITLNVPAQKGSQYGWSGSVDHPGIEPCGCDEYKLVNAAFEEKDAAGIPYGTVNLCNDSLYAYVQIYLGRGKQMNEVWLWTGRQGKVPRSGKSISLDRFLGFQAGYRNSYTLKAPLTDLFWTHDVSLVIRSYTFDGFNQNIPTNQEDIYLKGSPRRGGTVVTRSISSCCDIRQPTLSGTAYHYLPPILCGEVRQMQLLSPENEILGNIQIYSTPDSLAFVFNVKREHMLGKTYIWLGEGTSPRKADGSPDLNKFLMKNPWRQNYVLTLPSGFMQGGCTQMQIYAEVHKINLFSQSEKVHLVHPDKFPVKGWQYCPPDCCYQPVTK